MESLKEKTSYIVKEAQKLGKRLILKFLPAFKEYFKKTGILAQQIFIDQVRPFIIQSYKTTFRKVSGWISTLSARLPAARVSDRVKHNIISILIIALLMSNPFGSAMGKTINNQEFFTYHIKDLMEYVFSERASAETAYYLATDTYEKQLDGDLFGAAKGKNLILVQMESMQNMVIDKEYNGQEITPNLNKLIEDESSIYFDNFYSQIGAGNTSDAEFAANNSLFGSIESYTYQLFQDNYFYGLPKVLASEGYETAAFHGYKKDFWNRAGIYPSLGFNQFFGGDDYISDHIKGIGGGNIVGISDSAFFKQTIDFMQDMKEPFYGFVVTLSSHNPFGLPDQLKELKIKPEDTGNVFGSYLNSVHYADKCLGEFFDELKESGLYDDSIIILYGDHFAMSKSDDRVSESVSNWLGHEYSYDEMNNVPLIVHIPGENVNETISISGGELDLLPTISYLMGVPQLDTIYLGQNLFTAEKGFVPLQLHMIKGSFIMDDVVFEMSRDGIFKNSKAWNRLTKEPVDIEPYYEQYKAAKQAVEVSSFYLYNDVLRSVLLEGQNLNTIMSGIKETAPPPKHLTWFTVKSDDAPGLAALVKYMEENPKDYIALESDDLYSLLKQLEDDYSGKKGLTGSILYVDEVANSYFLEMRGKIIPVMDGSTNNYTKLEYLGYDRIIITPDKAGMNPDEMKAFIETNSPAGLMISDKEDQTYRQYADQYGVSLYMEQNGDTIEKIYN